MQKLFPKRAFSLHPNLLVNRRTWEYGSQHSPNYNPMPHLSRLFLLIKCSQRWENAASIIIYPSRLCCNINLIQKFSQRWENAASIIIKPWPFHTSFFASQYLEKISLIHKCSQTWENAGSIIINPRPSHTSYFASQSIDIESVKNVALIQKCSQMWENAASIIINPRPCRTPSVLALPGLFKPALSSQIHKTLLITSDPSRERTIHIPDDATISS